MATKKALSYLWGTATQGSADAFVQLSMATGLSGQTRTAYQIHEIMIEWGLAQVAASGAIPGVTSLIELALTRKSLTAMPVITEKSLIAKFGKQVSFTTSGLSWASKVERYTYTEDDNLLVVEDPVYWQLDSVSTSLTIVAEVRIGYVPVSISDVDRLTLVANSLAQ